MALYSSSSFSHKPVLFESFPSSNTKTLSAKSFTAPMSCSDIMIVVPKSLLILLSRCNSVSFAIGSSIEIGSSKIRTSGFATITEARFKICFCPPDNSPTLLKYQSVIPKYSAISVTLSLIISDGTPSFSSTKANS